jgi:hypothetical protein
MAKQTINGPQYDSQEFNTGDGAERGDSPKSIVEKLNENFTELYDAVAADDTAAASISEVLFVDVVVSSAELLALFATPKTIVAAPAAGLMNVFEGIVISKPAGTAYGGVAAGEDLAVGYTAITTPLATVETTGFLDQSTVQTRYAPKYAAASGVNSITPAAAAIVLGLQSGEIITGTSPLNCRVYYRVIPSVIA